MMVENFETKILDIFGPKEHGGQINKGRHLGRTIEYIEGEGYTWTADDKYANDIVDGLDLGNSKGSDLPATKGIGGNVRERDGPLNGADAALFKHLTGMALYLSLDRPSIQFAVCDIASGMANPKVIDTLKPRKLAKFLKKQPRETWVFNFQDCPRELWVHTDSDWASDESTRRSMSCCVERFGSHVIDCSCGRQSVVALSSGEAEFYSMTRGAASGIQTTQIFAGFGYDLIQVMKCDSSAARGIASRNGSGKVKHLSIKQLLLQEHVRNGSIRVDKVDALFNWSDIGTKALSSERSQSVMKQMPLRMTMIVGMVEGVRGHDTYDTDNEFDILTYLVFMFGLVTILFMGLCFMLGRWSTSLVALRIPGNPHGPDEDEPEAEAEEALLGERLTPSLGGK